MSFSLFPVAILAGGLATRLRPLTATVPKSLITVAGEPFLFHQLRLLSRLGVTRVVLCIGYLGDQIEDAVGNGRQFGLDVSYSYDGELLKGTGGAIRQALPKLAGRFFVMYGDSYLRCDLQAIQTRFLECGKLGLMTVFRNDQRWGESNVEFVHGRIIAYDKLLRRPQMKHIDYGVSLFHERAFLRFSDRTSFDLREVIQDLLVQDQLGAFEVDERFFEIGSPEGIRELVNYLQNGRKEGL